MIVLEGDSITSPEAPGVYSGAFKANRTDIEVHIEAVGGSNLNALIERRDDNIALNPDILTVFIGANGFDSDDPESYAQRVFDYVAPFRENGTRVLIGTILPSDTAGNTALKAKRDSARLIYAQIMEQAVGDTIDGIFDFGRHPIVGDNSAALNTQLFSDGLHPTWRGANSGIGGHDYLYDVFKMAIDEELREMELAASMSQ